jgi:hypothetical protein
VRTAAIILLGLLVLFLADRLVREENQRYAVMHEMCRDPLLPLLPDFDCLESVQTRTSWFWQLYYAVTDHLPAVPIFSW